MGKKYPITTWDEPGSDPKHPGNSRFTIGDSQITSGPVTEPEKQGYPTSSTFVSAGESGGEHSTGILDKDGNVIDTKP